MPSLKHLSIIAGSVPLLALAVAAGWSLNNDTFKFIPTISQVTAGEPEIYFYGTSILIFVIALSLFAIDVWKYSSRRVKRARYMRYVSPILGAISAVLFILSGFISLVDGLFPHTYFMQGFPVALIGYHFASDYLFGLMKYHVPRSFLFINILSLVVVIASIGLFYAGYYRNSTQLFSVGSVFQVIGFVLVFFKFILNGLIVF